MREKRLPYGFDRPVGVQHLVAMRSTRCDLRAIARKQIVIMMIRRMRLRLLHHVRALPCDANQGSEETPDAGARARAARRPVYVPSFRTCSSDVPLLHFR